MASTQEPTDELSQKEPLKNKRILIVDDDAMFRKSLLRLLERVGAEVIQAENGTEAANIFGLEGPDCTITDIRMPGMNGLELMHHIKRVKPDHPVILMTGFAEIKETEEAFQIGAAGFLSKPFNKSDLLEVLAVALNLVSLQIEQEQTSLDPLYCKIPLDDFVTGKTIQFNIFVRLSSTKYVKIANEGIDLSLERIQSYKEKGIKYLYIHKEDFKRYVGFNLAILSAVKDKRDINKEKKLVILHQATNTLLEDAFVRTVDADTYDGARITVDTMVSLVSDNQGLFECLCSLAQDHDPLYAHLIGVSFISVLIAKQHGWSSPATLCKISLSGLLHDIGKKGIPKSILTKLASERTPEETHLYETHPVRGYDMMAEIKGVPQEVLQAIMQHHEDCLGLGYPLKLTKNKIGPVAKLIAVADTFHNAFAPQGHPVCTPAEAVNAVLSRYQDRLDHLFLVDLQQLFIKASST